MTCKQLRLSTSEAASISPVQVMLSLWQTSWTQMDLSLLQDSTGGVLARS